MQPEDKLRNNNRKRVSKIYVNNRHPLLKTRCKDYLNSSINSNNRCPNSTKAMPR